MASIDSDVMQAIGYAEGETWESVAATNAAYDAAHPADTYLPDPVTEGPSEAFNALAWTDLPPEVAAALQPGTNPFASLEGAVAVQPTTPTGVGLAPGVPALAPAPYPNTIVVSTAPVYTGYTPGGVLPALIEWPLGVFELGKIVFEQIENRQAGGVRFGTLPMVVFQDNSGRGGF